MKVKNDNKISVIVPVFNSAQFLEKCVESICMQTYSNLEIILVDDGSTDNSGQLCDEFEKKDDRIVVIHQENAGQNAARKTGVLQATGKYLSFIDNDDWIEPDMYEKLLSKMDDCDLVTSGLFKYEPNSYEPVQWTDPFDEGIYKTSDDFFLKNAVIYSGHDEGYLTGGILNNLVSKLYRTDKMKEVVTEYLDINARYEEDLLLLLLYITKIEILYITHDIHYHYRYNSKSIVNNNTEDMLIDRAHICNALNDAIGNDEVFGILVKEYQKKSLYLMHTRVNYFINACKESAYTNWIFPMQDKIAGKRIVLFGAGRAGCSYLKNFTINGICRIEKWFDNKNEKLELKGIKLEQPKYINDIDYVVIAVFSEKSANDIKEQLHELGYSKNQILWDNPEDYCHKLFME